MHNIGKLVFLEERGEGVEQSGGDVWEEGHRAIDGLPIGTGKEKW